MKKSIWVVDDDQSVLEVIKIFLEEKNFEVVTINDPTTVIDRVSEIDNPDLILIDVHMVGRNGISITKELKENNKTKDVKIVIMTADIHIDEKAQEANADGFIRKPFGIEELLDTVNSFITN